MTVIEFIEVLAKVAKGHPVATMCIDGTIPVEIPKDAIRMGKGKCLINLKFMHEEAVKPEDDERGV